MEALREAARLNPDSAYVHHELGRALELAHDFDGAVAALRGAVARDPDEPRYQGGLAGALANTGQFEEANALLEDVLRWYADADTRVTLGEVQRKAGRLPESEATLRRTLEEAPNLPRAHVALGHTLAAMGDAEGAIRSHLEASRLGPDDWSPLKEAAHLLVGQQRYGEAREALERATALAPSRGYPPYLCGLSLLREGRLEEARKRFLAAKGLAVHPFWAADLESAIRECDACLALRESLPAILSGERRPADAAEARDFADLCFNHGRFAKASAFYGNGEDRLLRAACAAAMAGTGLGLDAPDPTSRPDFRWTALERLRGLLAATRRDSAANLAMARHAAALWRCDKAFAGLRGDALERLPPPERHAWLALWREVDAFLGGTE